MAPRRRWRWFAAVPLLMALATPATVLQDFAAVLPRLQPQQREALKRRALEWRGMSPGQRQSLQARIVEWEARPLRQRQALREAYAAWRRLPPIEQARVRAAAQRFSREPVERQAALRAGFEALDRSLRRGWLLGPALGADYAALQPLLAQVPVAEHEGVLQTLRAMSASQRGELAVLVQRTPPHEREALRRELLSTADAQRQQWLWGQLDR